MFFDRKKNPCWIIFYAFFLQFTFDFTRQNTSGNTIIKSFHDFFFFSHIIFYDNHKRWKTWSAKKQTHNKSLLQVKVPFIYTFIKVQIWKLSVAISVSFKFGKRCCWKKSLNGLILVLLLVFWQKKSLLKDSLHNLLIFLVKTQVAIL